MRIRSILLALAIVAGWSLSEDWTRLSMIPDGNVGRVLYDDSVVFACGEWNCWWKTHSASNLEPAPVSSRIVNEYALLREGRLIIKESGTTTFYDLIRGTRMEVKKTRNASTPTNVLGVDGLTFGTLEYIGGVCGFVVARDTVDFLGKKFKAWQNTNDLLEDYREGKFFANRGALFQAGWFCTDTNCWLDVHATKRSTDTARTWLAMPTYFTPENIAGDTIVAASEVGHRLMVSLDNGANWDSSTSADPGLRQIRFGCGRLRGLFVDSIGGVLDSVWWKSSDLGKTWFPEGDICNDEPNASSKIRWKAQNGNLFRSSDAGATFVRQPDWMFSGWVTKMRQGRSSVFVLRASSSAPWYSTNALYRWDGGVWSKLRDSIVDFEVVGDTLLVKQCLPDSATHRWQFQLQRSTDMSTWLPVVRNHWIGDLFSDGDGALFYGDSQSVFVSQDAGRTWGRKSGALPNGLWCDHWGLISDRRLVCWRQGSDTVNVETDSGWSRKVMYGAAYSSTYATLPGGRSEDGVFASTESFYPTRPDLKVNNSGSHAAMVRYRDTILAFNDSGVWAVSSQGGVKRNASEYRYAANALWCSSEAVGVVGEGSDSGLFVVDRDGVFWFKSAPGNTSLRSKISRLDSWHLVGRKLTLELRAGSKVRVDLISPDGRIQLIHPEGFLAVGTYRFVLPSSQGLGILRTSVDGRAKSELVTLAK